MGLEISHGCYSGTCGTFNDFRSRIALESEFFPPLELMDGFYHERKCPFNSQYSKQAIMLRAGLPIKWESLAFHPLQFLLNHSDNDGKIDWSKCGIIANSLQEILDNLGKKEPQDHLCCGDDHIFKDRLEKMIAGMREAFEKEEDLEFH